LIAKTSETLDKVFEQLEGMDIDPKHLLRLDHGVDASGVIAKYSKAGRVNAFLEERIALLAQVDELARSLEIEGAYGYTCETAYYFFKSHIKDRWDSFLRKANSLEDAVDSFPFYAFFADAPQPLIDPKSSFDAAMEQAKTSFMYIKDIFDQLESLRAFELLRTSEDRANYLLCKEAKVVALTSDLAAFHRKDLIQVGFRYHSLVMLEASRILEVEGIVPLTLQLPDQDTGKSLLERIVMLGDENEASPLIRGKALTNYSKLNQSLFTRLIRLGFPVLRLETQWQSRPSIVDLYRFKYGDMNDLPVLSETMSLANPGFAFDYQFVNVPDYAGHGEMEPRPGFYQNLGEAEFAVAVYQYMRLLGYPNDKISILTPYNGQKELILDVLETRCTNHPFFGNPRQVATIQQNLGQTEDYVILSLVRTQSLDRVREIRNIISGFAAAKSGLYILGRQSLLEESVELKPIFKKLCERPTNALWLHSDEKWSQEFYRKVDNTGLKMTKKDSNWHPEKNKEKVLKAVGSVEEMGSEVQRLTQAKIDSLKANSGRS
jgi:intron-binding protein aquarius